MSENQEHKTWIMLKRAAKGIALSSLPIGALVKDVNSTYLGAPIVWKIADMNHDGYPENSVTLITDQLITMRCIDAKESGNTYGNRRYSLSNIRQWLNSDAEAGKWYSAQHSRDAAPSKYNVWEINKNYANPYDSDVGFMNGFSEALKNSMLLTQIITATSSSASETITDKLFLLSITEVGCGKNGSISEGSKLAIFNDNASRLASFTAEAIAQSNYIGDPKPGVNWYWRTRSSAFKSSESGAMLGITNDGRGESWTNAYNGTEGIRPLCNLPSTVRVSKTPDENGVYTIVQFK